jgi:hypothetical protein
MIEFDGTRVRVGLLTSGFEQAYARRQVAELEDDTAAAFHALFEALEWAHAVDEVIASTRRPRGRIGSKFWWEWRRDGGLGGGDRLIETMQGLRYVRNRVHHQLADALMTGGPGGLPVSLPARLPVSAWVWRGVDDLPMPSNEAKEAPGREAYVSALAGRPVENAVARMSEPFAFIGTLLDPPIAVRTAPR